MTVMKMVILKSRTVVCSVCRRQIKAGEQLFSWHGKYNKVMGRCCSEECSEKFINYWDQYQKDDTPVIECVKCGGTKLIRIACHICEGDPHEYNKYREFDAQNDECDECGGQGWIEKECPVCEGTGEVKESLIEPSDYDIL